MRAKSEHNSIGKPRKRKYSTVRKAEEIVRGWMSARE
jgi:hypothetical protein